MSINKRTNFKINKVNNITFNVGGGLKNSLSLNELTYYSQNVTKNNIDIKKKIKTSNYDIRYYITNNKKVYSKYKWRVKKTLQKTIIETFLTLKKNQKKLLKIL